MGDTIVIETPVATVLEVSGKQGPQGIPGATGATGATGPAGPAGTGIETLTTKGDLLSRDDNAAIRVGIGSTGQVLKVSAQGLPTWANESGAVTSVNGQTGSVVLDAEDVGAAATAHTHVAADVTDLSLNKVPEARQTYNITSTNSASPTQVDAQSAFQTASGSIDCVIVLNNTTGIVYADIVVPDLLSTPGSQRGRVIIEATTSGSGDITNFRINAEGTSIYPATGFDEIQPTERLVLVWTGDNWNLESLHTASSPVRISLPSYAGTLPAYANSVPTTPTSNGSPGMLFYSVAQDRLYICVATNTWRRIPIATW